MAKALNPRKTHDFVLEADRSLPPAEQTVFRLRPLSAAEHAAVMDQFGMGQKGQAIVAACQMSLTGWANLHDEDGRNVPFPESGACDWLPQMTVMEIGNAVLALSTLDKDLLGKSRPVSAQG